MTYGYQPYSPTPPPPQRSGGSAILWIILGALGAGALLTCACCGGGAFMFTRAPTVSASAKQPFAVAAIPPPAFPERGAPVPFKPDFQLFRVRLSSPIGNPTTPGHGGNLWLYLPAGQHAPQSLPCVLITGAGTTMLHGISLGDYPHNFDDEGDFDEMPDIPGMAAAAEEDMYGETAEHLPYVRAGFAVVVYELDGAFDDEFGEGEDDEMKRAYTQFRAAHAGVVNARNALEFVLARVPEVNPQKIYAAGHSSAGTLALLFAEHEPRLAGCVAYAPCIDLTERFTPMGIRGLSFMLPDLADFAVQSSPKTHEARLNCPVFLFHAEDDSNVPCDDSRACERRLKSLGKDVTLATVPTGDHYESMIQQGIPQAIGWLKQR